MSRRARLILVAFAGVALLAVLLAGFGRLPPFGGYHGVYGRVITHVELGARHATDYVTALNFDIRAFDTLGEEFILFASVTGLALILRNIGEENQFDRRADTKDLRSREASAALRALSLVLIALLSALAIYLVLHGALTPGGGFQGGVVLAVGPLAIMLGARHRMLRRLIPDWASEVFEALGASGYTLIGLGGLIFGSVFFKNFLPYGKPDMLLSAGTMPLNSIAVGLEVAGALLLTFTEFLGQALPTVSTGDSA